MMWQLSQQKLSRQTKARQFNFYRFFNANFFNFKHTEKTRSGRDSNPRLQGAKATAKSLGEVGRNLKDAKVH